MIAPHQAATSSSYRFYTPSFDELSAGSEIRHFRNAFLPGVETFSSLGELSLRSRPAVGAVSLRLCTFAHIHICCSSRSRLRRIRPALGTRAIGSRQWRPCPPLRGETSNHSARKFFYRLGTCSHIHAGSPPHRRENYGILHDELATPHQTKSGPDFIAEFRLNLVQVKGISR
jgi:hypothetical protein